MLNTILLHHNPHPFTPNCLAPAYLLISPWANDEYASGGDSIPREAALHLGYLEKFLDQGERFHEY